MDKSIHVKSRLTNRPLIESGKVTHIYGPPKSGKSTLSAHIALALAKIGKKTLIISTERPIEIRMLAMIEADRNFNQSLLNSILTSEIYMFDELIKIISNQLPSNLINVDLLIIDSLTSLYRNNASSINSSLLRKTLATLQSFVLNKKIAIFFTNQVASKMDGTSDFKPVASTSTRSYSDITTRITRKSNGFHELTFEDMYGVEEEVLEPFSISKKGIEEFDQLFIITS